MMQMAKAYAIPVVGVTAGIVFGLTVAYGAWALAERALGRRYVYDWRG